MVNESNDGLNGIRGATYSGIYDSAYALAAQDAKSNLGVDKLDFANKNHRIAIGDALLKNVMQAGDCTKTGSLVKAC